MLSMPWTFHLVALAINYALPMQESEAAGFEDTVSSADRERGLVSQDVVSTRLDQMCHALFQVAVLLDVPATHEEEFVNLLVHMPNLVMLQITSRMLPNLEGDATIFGCGCR